MQNTGRMGYGQSRCIVQRETWIVTMKGKPTVCLLLVTRRTSQDKDRLSASSPCTRLRIEAPWKSCTAKLAAAAFIQIPTSKLIPIAFDKHLTARRTIGRIVFHVVDITDVNVMQTGDERLLAGANERLWRCPRNIKHFEVRVERGKMQWYIPTE